MGACRQSSGVDCDGAEAPCVAVSRGSQGHKGVSRNLRRSGIRVVRERRGAREDRAVLRLGCSGNSAIGLPPRSAS